MIKNFKEEYAFLSNSYRADVCIDGITYTCVDAAVQAQEIIYKEQDLINKTDEWSQCKEWVLFDTVLMKFLQNSDLGRKLLDTGEEEISDGISEMGKILMDVRFVLQMHELDFAVTDSLSIC